MISKGQCYCTCNLSNSKLIGLRAPLIFIFWVICLRASWQNLTWEAVNEGTEFPFCMLLSCCLIAAWRSRVTLGPCTGPNFGTMVWGVGVTGESDIAGIVFCRGSPPTSSALCPVWPRLFLDLNALPDTFPVLLEVTESPAIQYAS
jgi:hypothetical protein